MIAMDFYGPMLSVPAARPEMIDKAVASGARAVLVDLEDAVTASEKDRARARTVEWLSARSGLDLPVIVRVNAPRSPWCHLDVIALAGATGVRPALMLPKVESAADLGFVERLLDGAELAGADPLPLIALLETATGILAAPAIAAASPRLTALSIGYADLAASLGRPPRQSASWTVARDTVVLAARSARLQAIDGPHLGIEVDADFETDLATTVAAGFDAKWVLHPRQVGPTAAAFGPNPDELDRARAIVAALDEAGTTGSGVTRVGGLMVDEAVARSARRLLALGEA